ncbi:MAG: hypothetical protein AAFY46_00280 [Planctomycetota bacterium]
MPTNRFAIAAAAAAVLSVPLLSGCIYGSSSSQESGTRVGAKTFGRIIPGETTDRWVLATLGEPNRHTTYEDGRELWVYTYRKDEKSKGTFLLVIGGSDKSTTREATYIEFEDGIVTEAWRE